MISLTEILCEITDKFEIVYNLQFSISKFVNFVNFLTKVGNTEFLLHSFVSIEAPRAKKSKHFCAIHKISLLLKKSIQKDFIKHILLKKNSNK